MGILAIPIRMVLVPDSVAAKGREAERGKVSPTGLWIRACMARKKTNILFVIEAINFVISDNKHGCCACVLVRQGEVRGRLILSMRVARLIMSHRVNDVAFTDRTGSPAGSEPRCTRHRLVYGQLEDN